MTSTTTIYEVSVERTGFGYIRHIMTAAPTGKPELAAEAGERLVARELYGDDWAKVIHEFFAFRVKEMTAADLMAKTPLAPSVVDVGTITEYGLTQKLSTPIRCF